MFARTVRKQDIPEHDNVDLEAAMCPPHDFDNGWALHADSTNGEDTKPALYCKACGEVRLFRIPPDAG